MAVSAYASLLSLTQVLNNVQNRARLRNIHADINQIETLLGRVNYLVRFLEIHHQSEDERLNGLWRKISEIAFEAQEMFDLHVVIQLLERPILEAEQKFHLHVFNEILRIFTEQMVTLLLERYADPLLEDVENMIQKIDHIEICRFAPVERQTKASLERYAALLQDLIEKIYHEQTKASLERDAPLLQDMIEKIYHKQTKASRERDAALLQDMIVKIFHEQRKAFWERDPAWLEDRIKKIYHEDMEDMEEMSEKINNIKTELQVVEEVQGDVLPVERQTKASLERFAALLYDMENMIEKIDHIRTELPVVEEVKGDVVPVERQPKASLERYAAFREDVENMIQKIDHIEPELPVASEERYAALLEDMENMIEKIDHIKTELPVVEEVQGDVVRVERKPEASMSVGGKNVMVGFDEHRLHIMDELTNDTGSFKIIPITGMGGIGKTTLAKNVFEDPCIVEHFHMKIWVTVSQTYSVHKILTGLLNNGVVEKGSGDSESLGVELHKKLFGRRYLIVMDDMWATEAWDDLKRFFPKNENGSRIMVTTRLENVAKSLDSCDPYSISFLEEKEGWNLFCQISFGEEDCPFPELEEIGKRIASSCRGLPLEITAIGGLLANSKTTKEFWESVAENVSSLANSGYDEHCLQVLFLSYNNLPIHLKPCFLYLRSYPEDPRIDVDELIHRWVAEGFIKPADGQKSLEEIATEYLMDLISRNLIFIRKWDWDLKLCGVHDLFRDLCLRESKKQCFIHPPIVQHASSDCDNCFQCGEHVSNEEAVKLQNFVTLPEATRQGTTKTFRNYVKKSKCAAKSVDNRIFGFRSHGAVVKSVDAGNIASSSQVSPSVCGACQGMYSNLKEPRLVRIINKENHEDDRNYVHSTHSRYFMMVDLANQVKLKSPSLIHLLWNLQILGIQGASLLPKEIWELPEIRHIQVGAKGGAIFENPSGSFMGKLFILKNLQTLSDILVHSHFTWMVFDRIPNLNTLSLRYEGEQKELGKYFLQRLFDIKTLKSLTLHNFKLESTVFPNSLKELVLKGCNFSWNHMPTIGSLPYLEVLSLKWSGVEGMWAPIEGQFLQLRVLEIISCDLVQWKADKTNFPKLEKLLLRKLPFFMEIPSEIGDIDTLQTIELYDLREAAINSAKQIWEEQQSYGNDSLQINVYKDYHYSVPIQYWNV